MLIPPSLLVHVLFTVAIRLNDAREPAYAHVLKNDTAESAGARFCAGAFPATPTPPPAACIAAVADAVRKRVAWARQSAGFQIVPHRREVMLSIDWSAAPPRFDVRNPDTLWDGVAFLRRHGYAVFAHVGDAREVAETVDLFWDYFARRFGALRGDPRTWDRIPANEFGILLQFGVGQSDALWKVRQLARLHRVFAAVWGTEDLIVDFGGCVVLRPLSDCTQRWRTAEGWFHTDQNANSRPGLQTVQGGLLLTDQTPATGGLVVVPRSMSDHTALSRRAAREWGTSDDNHFLLVPPDDPVLHDPARRPLFVAGRKGDLVLWDSRTVHCNSVGNRSWGPTEAEEGVEGEVAARGTAAVVRKMQELRDDDRAGGDTPTTCADVDGAAAELQRLVALVSMAPRSMATADVLALRRAAPARDQTTTHWPFLFEADDPAPPRDVTLTAAQLKLIG